MPLRPAAGKHEPPSPPRQDQQQPHTHTHSHTRTQPYTHTAAGSQGGSTDSGSSREEDGGVPVGVAALRPGAERSGSAAAMEEPTGNTVVVRVGIPDLQQTPGSAERSTMQRAVPPRKGRAQLHVVDGVLKSKRT
ncbi:hypothetical protein EYF80_045655 [Liparis tanakae]|uniref:Uncharacterized protein n=1 Tax=Liparis tanakae TaxID=230148 RepID=A0A4Z2FSF6_9TELE|nr:hypothetical protein EYF80_045655 [Liparis tanakae]